MMGRITRLSLIPKVGCTAPGNFCIFTQSGWPRSALARRSPVTRSAHGSGMGPAWEYGFMDARRLAHMLA